jgi:hypothetical protein
MTTTHVTIDHEKIRQWAEKRGCHPATVKATERDHEPGVLRLDCDPPDETLDGIDWDEFFEKFDKAKLAFLYQEKTADGKISRFNKLVSRDSVADKLEEEKAGH